MLFILFSVAFLSSAKSQTIYDFDNVAAKLDAFGDPNNYFPINSIEAESLCAQYRRLAPLASPYLSDIGKSYGITGVNNISADVVCQLYKESPNIMIKFAAEVNTKSYQMTGVRQKIINLCAFTANGKVGHDLCLNYPQMGCYVKTWYNGITNVLSDQSKLIMNKISAFYLGFADAFSPLSTCDYSIVPNASQIIFQSFDLNHLIAVKNCFSIY